jgi:plasmid maintenance system antidote protein VapI
MMQRPNSIDWYIGRRLANVMAAKFVTADGLAHDIGSTPGAINEMLTGRHIPAETMMRISQSLNVKVAALMRI